MSQAHVNSNGSQRHRNRLRKYPSYYQHQRQQQQQLQTHQWLGRQSKSRSGALNWKPLPNITFGGKYRLLSYIGNGSFGQLYRAASLKHGEEVAIKLESSNAKQPQLPREAKIYDILRGGFGFPHIRHFGTEHNYNVLVLDLLGPSLEDLLNFCSRKFSIKTTVMLADQILARVEYVHRCCLLHRDIKPENFLMGLGRQRRRLFMIDFGLAKKFISPRTQQHISYNESHKLIGTARYASIHAHYAEQGRRDDLESVGYLLLYLLRGTLPWQGIRAASRPQKYEKIAECKSAMPLSKLCAGLPHEFLMYLKYCRSLNFTETPDYMYLRQLFKVLLRNPSLPHDYLYDWVHLEQEHRRRQQARKRDRDRTLRYLFGHHQHKRKPKEPHGQRDDFE